MEGNNLTKKILVDRQVLPVDIFKEKIMYKYVCFPDFSPQKDMYCTFYLQSIKAVRVSSQ